MRGIKKNKVLMVILYVALTLVIASVCFAFVKIGKLEKTKDIKSSSYTIGALNAEDGKEVKHEHAHRTGYFEVRRKRCRQILPKSRKRRLYNRRAKTSSITAWLFL